MKQRKSYVILIALGIITALFGVVGNIASSVLPISWKPYAWVSWLLLIPITLIYILLSIIDRKEQENSTDKTRDIKNIYSDQNLGLRVTEPLEMDIQDDQFLSMEQFGPHIKEADKKSTNDKTHDLFKALNERCSLSDLKDLCFFLGIDYDNYSYRKSDFIRELLLDLEKREMIEPFIDAINTQKPWVLKH